MMQLWNALVWLAETLDPINSLIGLITTAVAGFTAFIVWKDQRRRKVWLQEIAQRPGERPSILILDLLVGQDARAQIENFRQRQKGLKDIPEERIQTVARGNKLTPADMPQLQQDIRTALAKLMQAGTDRIHLFLAAPQPATAVAGALLANTSAVIYHFDREAGTYVNYGLLRPVE